MKDNEMICFTCNKIFKKNYYHLLDYPGYKFCSDECARSFAREEKSRAEQQEREAEEQQWEAERWQREAERQQQRQVEREEEWNRRAKAAQVRRKVEEEEANSLKCTGCGKILPPNAKFCQGCGTAVPGLICACGVRLADDAKFCPGCGKPAPAPSAGPRTGPPPLPKAPKGMVRINGGSFLMGSPESEERSDGRDKDEGPQHKVTLSSFYLGRCAVTQKEYLEIMGTNPSTYQNDEYMPVTNLIWEEIAEYCNKLSKREGLQPAYTTANGRIQWNKTANGYRLPTEAEWEYACRAGTTSPWNTGTGINHDQANFNWATSMPTPVCAYPPNKWGLYDMHGNVQEECWPCYKPRDYDKGDKNNPGLLSCKFPSDDEEPGMAARGGSCDLPNTNIRSAVRWFLLLNGGVTRWDYYGFRLARNCPTAQGGSVLAGSVTPVPAAQPAAPRCAKCGATPRAGAKFCNKCGSPIQVNNVQTAAPRCAKCGATSRAGAKFCNKCGNPMHTP